MIQNMGNFGYMVQQHPDNQNISPMKYCSSTTDQQNPHEETENTKQEKKTEEENENTEKNSLSDLISKNDKILLSFESDIDKKLLLLNSRLHQYE